MFFFFFFNDTATTEIYTLSLHDALPISFSTLPSSPTVVMTVQPIAFAILIAALPMPEPPACTDRKSTRLNSSHLGISYAVFCLKKKHSNDPWLNAIVGSPHPKLFRLLTQ